MLSGKVPNEGNIINLPAKMRGRHTLTLEWLFGTIVNQSIPQLQTDPTS